MRVTKIGPPTPTYRKALGYDPNIPDDDVEPPVFEGAYVLIPRDDSGPMEFVPAPTVTDGDLTTYALTSEHDEAMRIVLDFPVRFSGAVVLGAWETAGDRTYTFEGADQPDFSDAVELDESTVTAVADWVPVELIFDYPSPTIGHQYYRIVGPDEERRWHNLQLIEDTREGCECLELCRDPEPAVLVASNDSPDLAQSDPVELGVAPGAGDLWLIVGSTGSVDGFDLIAGPMDTGGTISAAMFTREAQSGDTGSVIIGFPTHWLTATWSGVSTAFDAIEELDTQSTGGAATCEVPITVPAGDHLVIVYVNHDNTLAPTAEAGWTLVETQSYATTKYQALAYAFVSGGSLTPGIVVSAAGSWFGFAASFPVLEQGEAIEGGPNATAGDGTKAAPCTHDHHYTAEQVEVTPFGTIAADNVQDALEEIVAEASGGTPATTVESETTFGITPAVGTDTEYARQDHTHGSPANPLTGAALTALGLVGPLLIADDHSTPLVFEDILQTEEGDDFLYADIGA